LRLGVGVGRKFWRKFCPWALIPRQNLCRRPTTHGGVWEWAWGASFGAGSRPRGRPRERQPCWGRGSCPDPGSGPGGFWTAVAESGNRRTAPPLWQGAKREPRPSASAPPEAKAVSPLRSATAVQNHSTKRHRPQKCDHESSDAWTTLASAAPPPGAWHIARIFHSLPTVKSRPRQTQVAATLTCGRGYRH